MAQKKADKIGMGCMHNRVIHTTHEFPAQVNQRHKSYIVAPHDYLILCRLGWVDQKRRQVLYQRYNIIRATQVLYQLPIKTSGEDSCIATNEIFAAVTIETT